MFEGRWQRHVKCKRGDARAIGPISNDIKCVSLPFESIKNGRNILWLPDPKWLNFQAEIASRVRNVIFLRHGRRIGGIAHCQAAEIGDKLTQDFEPLTGTFGAWSDSPVTLPLGRERLRRGRCRRGPLATKTIEPVLNCCMAATQQTCQGMTEFSTTATESLYRLSATAPPLRRFSLSCRVDFTWDLNFSGSLRIQERAQSKLMLSITLVPVTD